MIITVPLLGKNTLSQRALYGPITLSSASLWVNTRGRYQATELERLDLSPC